MTNKVSWLAQLTFVLSFLLLATSCSRKLDFRSKHIVFVSGEEEYRSEESFPMIAKILERETGAKVSFCFSVDSAGYIDPNNTRHIAGLEKLQDADLMVLFARFRALPQDELKYITDYVESGKPIIGLRTSTHAFLYQEDSMKHMNNEWPTKVFGQQWITHHGHFEDGNKPLTSVYFANKMMQPILRGVKPFDAYSWLYHVDGGEWKLQGDCNILLQGKSLKSNHEMEGNLDKFPMTNPVAWTKNYKTSSGKSSKVFFTTLGHPYDFKDVSMRKLLLNSIFWALDAENKIPENGVNAEPVDIYEPSNSGFGQKYKKGVKLEEIK
ncbi:MAG: ThuA domain-containing protein [Saprospiraceae bacterium]|nr:ThuA domain-containing protein [Saprospiraceae bacterium]